MVERTLDASVLEQWIGKTEIQLDTIDAKQANLMAATLGSRQVFQVGDPLPALWHWIYFLTALPTQDLGRDGHPKLGGYLPPVKLPRRMWAGGRFVFSAPLLIGETVERISSIKAIAVKQGRTGALCFVTVAHEFKVDGQLRLTEEHDIVYREDPLGDQAAKQLPVPPQGAEIVATVSADQTMLFRYSALTFNGHRIHYDRDYCRDVEGYPDLVVHGPLIATLLLNHAVAHHAEKKLRSFDFRALSPICGDQVFTLNQKQGRADNTLWAQTADGVLAMLASAEFA